MRIDPVMCICIKTLGCSVVEKVIVRHLGTWSLTVLTCDFPLLLPLPNEVHLSSFLLYHLTFDPHCQILLELLLARFVSVLLPAARQFLWKVTAISVGYFSISTSQINLILASIVSPLVSTLGSILHLIEYCADNSCEITVFRNIIVCWRAPI